MGILRFLFAPEIGRALGEARRAGRRFGRSVRSLTDGVPGGKWRWRRLLERERRARALLGAALSALGLGLVALGATGLTAGSAHAQTIDPEIFATKDNATRDLLAFLSDVGVARHAVLGDMLFVFNGGVLVLAGFLLLWHTVAGTVDTARTGRWGFGAWEIVRVVVAVALMAPLPGGMNGAQHAVVGLATLGGDFAGAVWTPFSEQALGLGRSHRAPPQGRRLALRHRPRAAGRDLPPRRQRQRAAHRRRSWSSPSPSWPPCRAA